MRLSSRLIALLALPFVASAQNLLINPSFDSLAEGSGGIVLLDFTTGSTGAIDGWGIFGTSGAGATNSVDGTTVYGAGQDGDRFIALGGGSSSNGKGLFQTFFATAGQSYAVSIYARYFGVGDFVRGGFQVEDATSDFETVGAVTFAVIPSRADELLTNSWQQYSFGFTALNTGIHRVLVRDFTVSGGGTNTDILFDNASLTAIPEPASAAALLGLGALGCAALRRRSRRA